MTELDATQPVRFGEFVLDPGEERVTGPAGEVRIGRKAYRLLSVLIARPGALVTKDALLASVWDGTLVSESAITATVKELRRALGDEAKSPRFIETLYGRGYRFIAPVTAALAPVAPAPPSGVGLTPPASPTSTSRRRVLGGAIAALGVGAAGAAVIPSLLRPDPPAEVAALIASARQLLDQNTRAGQNQAIGLLRRVTELAPDHADGWGQLGIAYAVPSHYRERPEALMLRTRARAAGDRALELDGRCVSGELAHAVELPFVGNWRARDERLARALANGPDNDDALEFTATTRLFNGRASAALPLFERIRRRPFTPGLYGSYVATLRAAGRIDDAERVLGDASALYPTQASLWFERFELLLYGGRADAAAALAGDATNRPTGVDDAVAADLRAWAAAVDDPAGAAARRTMARLIALAHEDSLSAESAIRLAGALGDRDAAFAVADAYYFSRGFAVPDSAAPGSAASTDQRLTAALFDPETASLRADPRFERLVAEIGLDGYWRQAGVVPDYRAKRS
jgi:DNA-binding winged helix-turn-helix (wHTH) protein